MTRVRMGCPDVVTVKPGAGWASDLDRASLEKLWPATQLSGQGTEVLDLTAVVVWPVWASFRPVYLPGLIVAGLNQNTTDGSTGTSTRGF